MSATPRREFVDGPTRRPYSGGISSCCGKGLIIVSDDREGTCYYECEKCGDACDDRNFGGDNG